MGVRVVTDSSAVVPQAWVDAYPLHIVPLQMAWDDGEVADDGPYAALAARLERGRQAPKTAAPSPGAFEELFRELLARDDSLLVVCPPAELSMTVGSATLAARNVGEGRVRVLDGRTAAAGQGIVASQAAKAAASGMSLPDVHDRARAVAEKVQIWATLSQLDFLRRSGRVPAIAAIGAGALGLQPIVRYAEGTPSLAAVTRSGRRGAERIIRAWQQSIVDEASLALVALHSARADEAEEILRRVLERTPDADAHVVEISASMAAHTGPGLLGLAWFWEK